MFTNQNAFKNFLINIKSAFDNINNHYKLIEYIIIL